MTGGNKKKTENGTESPGAPAPEQLQIFDASEQDSEAVRILKRELQEKITSLTEANRQLKRKIFDLYTIFEISRNFSSVLDYHQLLDTFIYTSMAQVGSSKAAVYLERHPRNGVYVMAEHKGSGDFPEGNLSFASGSTLLEYLTKLNRPCSTGELISDLASSREREILSKFHPGLVVPLIFQSQLGGLLLVTDKMSGQEFTMDDIEFLSILGNKISVAIENTRLYEAEKKASRQLREAQEQLVHSERLAALGEMSAKVAHEINNPLGIIKNYLLLVRKAVRGKEQGLEHVNVLSQEIERIARIVKELLDFHRPRGLEFQKVNAAMVLSDVLLLMERQMESKKIDLVKRFDPGVPQIEASPESLKQVFLNIIINACDVMGEGGRLEVDLTREDDQVSIKFQDSGAGIPPEVVPRIFEPFFTTKQPGKGTGLGLSVCYGIIKQHGGSITYRNTDQGGCFEIRLPVKAKPEVYGDGQ
ncbi:MAG: GAF domain-containing protein [Candidatus Zixiibacteriota bacterium]|nr:MAG: GAF domain-containing protein [candidate division Zixibacteria bacterium]